MKLKWFFIFKVAMAILAFCFVACVDDSHDLSKDIDATIGVGKGISFPLGSTEQIKLTEMIDKEGNDVIVADGAGNFSIEEYVSVETDVTIENVKNATISPVSETAEYSMKSEKIDRAELDKLPEAVREQVINNTKFTHVVNQVINHNKVKFSLNMSGVPEDVRLVNKVMFAKPVEMTINMVIYTKENNEQFDDILHNLHMHTDGVDGDHFYVQLPSYVIVEENVDLGPDNRLYIEGVAARQPDGSNLLQKKFFVDGLDFGNEGLDVVNGKLNDETTLNVNGRMVSDPLTLTGGQVIDIPSVFVDANLEIAPFEIAEVTGLFDTDIDAAETQIMEIELNDDMDFIYDEDAVFNFKNPQLLINIDNEATVDIKANVKVTAEYNNKPSKSIDFDLMLDAAVQNNFYVTADGSAKEGYKNVRVPVLRDLLSDAVPTIVKIDVAPSIDKSKTSTMKLGKKMLIAGDCIINIPMEFDNLELEYTETVEDVLGDDPSEFTDYIKNFKCVTISADAFNTCPIKFTPNIVARDYMGNVLNNIVAVPVGAIEAGNGYDAEPVQSSFKIKLSAENDELLELNTIDIIFSGEGAGMLNENSYLQLKNITITIDSPIDVDFN